MLGTMQPPVRIRPPRLDHLPCPLWRREPECPCREGEGGEIQSLHPQKGIPADDLVCIVLFGHLDITETDGDIMDGFCLDDFADDDLH